MKNRSQYFSFLADPRALECSPIPKKIEDVSINNEYEENDFKPYSYSKSFSQLSMLAMTPSSSL